MDEKIVSRYYMRCLGCGDDMEYSEQNAKRMGTMILITNAFPRCKICGGKLQGRIVPIEKDTTKEK